MTTKKPGMTTQVPEMTTCARNDYMEHGMTLYLLGDSPIKSANDGYGLFEGIAVHGGTGGPVEDADVGSQFEAVAADGEVEDRGLSGT